MPEPPQLAPFYAKEQRLYSESLSDDRASHPILKGDAGHAPENPFWPLVSVYYVHSDRKIWSIVGQMTGSSRYVNNK